MDTRFKKWINWLKIIESEIYDLVLTKDIFWRVQDLIRKNKRIQKPSIFYRYMGDTYVSHVIIGIRRQVKIDKQSISFARLLSEISQDPKRITRKYFVSLYKDSVVEDIADNDFDKFCGADPSYISQKMVEDDLDSLRRVANKCEDFADKRVAHRDKRDPKSLLKFGDVDDCIDFFDNLYCKYHLIFHAEWTGSLKPSYLTDWEAIFDHPWRVPDSGI
jgi:hypothetical protein